MPGLRRAGYYCLKGRKWGVAKAGAKDSIKLSSCPCPLNALLHPFPPWVETSVPTMASKVLCDSAYQPPLTSFFSFPCYYSGFLCSVTQKRDNTVPQPQRAWPHLKVRANPDSINSQMPSDYCTLSSWRASSFLKGNPSGLFHGCHSAQSNFFQKAFPITTPHSLPITSRPDVLTSSLPAAWTPTSLHIQTDSKCPFPLLCLPLDWGSGYVILFTIVSPTLTKIWHVEGIQQMAAEWKYKWINDYQLPLFP